MSFYLCLSERNCLLDRYRHSKLKTIDHHQHWRGEKRVQSTLISSWIWVCPWCSTRLIRSQCAAQQRLTDEDLRQMSILSEDEQQWQQLVFSSWINVIFIIDASQIGDCCPSACEEETRRRSVETSCSDWKWNFTFHFLRSQRHASEQVEKWATTTLCVLFQSTR